MKTKSLFKNILTGTAVLSFAIFMSSCKKNDVDESGSASIKFVNASSASTPQSVYLANQAVVNGGLDFGESTDYIVTNSGNNLELQFRNEGSTTAYASDKFSVDRNRNYTAFLAGDGQAARVKFFTDDLTAPAAGQAKVRFVHISDAGPANVDIKRANGDVLAANLARDNASAFTAIAPGVLSLQVFQAGQGTSLASFDLSAFAEGKIYTIYITGSTPQTITVRQIVHN
jgi:hypothetical protein